jgi:16S rRNA (cytosine967-C5)-methyltransferase
VIAVDRAPRLARLRDNAARLGLGARLEIRAGDARALAPEPCDAVLVDAPCSGLGVVRRHADLRWTKREEEIPRLAALQGKILDAAARWVRPGGRLVYSTCSVLEEENEDVVRAFLTRHPEFRLDPLPVSLAAFAAGDSRFFRAWPQRHGTDGAFGCRMLRDA